MQSLQPRAPSCSQQTVHRSSAWTAAGWQHGHRSARARQIQVPGAASASQPLPSEPSQPSSQATPAPEQGASAPETSQSQPQPGLWGRVKRFVLGDKQKMDMARLRALGMGAVASYGVVSNINAGILVTLAWLSIVKTQGVTPLAPGMWPKFLGVYAGLWVSSHFMRPIRLSIALAMAPAFDAALTTIMKKTGLNKPAAFGIMLVCVALGSIAFLLTLLTVSGGFPNGLRWG